MANYQHLVALLAMILIALTVQTTHSRLPCTHPLRISVPRLFQHCGNAEGCSYSQWSDWQPDKNSVVSVSVSQCPSGKAYKEKRTRTTTGPNLCNELSEEKNVCLPDQEDRLIMTLNLGGSGHNLKPVQPVQPDPDIDNEVDDGDNSDDNIDASSSHTKTGQTKSTSNARRRIRRQTARCPANGNTGQICQHLTDKRSISFSDELIATKEDLNQEKVKEQHAFFNKAPEQFNWNEHGPRLRRQTQNCISDDVQHILFVFDSSGSIGSTEYQRMKNAIGKLVPLFCKQVKFAMVTFSSEINLEFCFDCFENTYQGRTDVKSAIDNAQYHSKLTYTGAATKCICEELLSDTCGISSNPSCLDVVYITDGESNDQNHQVCQEVECLHRRTGINTYAIGINNFDETELDCISESTDILSTFQFRNFTEFEMAIDNTITRLEDSLQNGNLYTCVQRDDTISPTGAVPFDG